MRGHCCGCPLPPAPTPVCGSWRAATCRRRRRSFRVRCARISNGSSSSAHSSARSRRCRAGRGRPRGGCLEDEGREQRRAREMSDAALVDHGDGLRAGQGLGTARDLDSAVRRCRHQQLRIGRQALGAEDIDDDRPRLGRPRVARHAGPCDTEALPRPPCCCDRKSLGVNSGDGAMGAVNSPSPWSLAVASTHRRHHAWRTDSVRTIPRQSRRSDARRGKTRPSGSWPPNGCHQRAWPVLAPQPCPVR